MINDMAVLEQDKTSATPWTAPEGAERYTHGMENIYAVETIDLSTVRPMESGSKEVLKTVLTAEQIPPQLELPYADSFRSTLESFRLSEPMRVLSLSAMAERGLTENGILTIRDLIEKDSAELKYLKGLGQGHLDEIGERLGSYLDQGSLYHSTTVDFVGLVRSVLSTLKTKDVHVLLESYGLGELISLTPAEKAEVRHLNEERRQAVIDDAMNVLRKEEVVAFLAGQLSRAVKVFVVPWIRGRCGLARDWEAEERLVNVSVVPDVTPAILALFAGIWGIHPLSEGVVCVEGSIYASDSAVARRAVQVLDLASEYFSAGTEVYALDELTAFVERECALRWIGFQEGFVAKAIRLSSRFMVRKAASGVLAVRRDFI
jgi:hypothetical protein